MKLSQFASHITKEAEVRGYATDKSRAADPIVKPFSIFENQKKQLLSLQESTLRSCWIDDKKKIVPFDPAGFEALQSDINHLQDAISKNELVLDELEKAVEDMNIDRMSLGILKMERSKALDEIEFLKAEPDKALTHKWRAIQEIHGSRDMYENLPEVQAAREQAAAKIAPIQARIEVLSAQIERLEAILAKFMI